MTSQLWTPPTDRVNGPSEIKWDIAYAAKAALVEHENYVGYASSAPNNSYLPKVEALDALIAEVNAVVDTDAQKELFKQIQQIVNDNMYDIPLYHQIAFVYTSDKLDTKGYAYGNDQFYYDSGILDWTTAREDGTMYTNGGPEEFFQAPLVNPGLFIHTDLVFSRLINCDAGLNPTDGNIAETYAFADNNLTLNMKIREGMTWHDGEPLTPEDVRFTLELYAKAPGMNAVIADVIKSITGAQDFIDGNAENISGIVIDGFNMQIKFDKVAANTLPALCQWPILPKHKLENAAVETLQQDQYWQKPIGSGPYMLDEVVIGNYATLKRWDGYYKKGTGNIQKIYMHASTENDANLVKNAGGGMMDYAFGKSTADAIALEDMPSMTVNPVSIRYTRVFYVNQFPHEPNIK